MTSLAPPIGAVAAAVAAAPATPVASGGGAASGGQESGSQDGGDLSPQPSHPCDRKAMATCPTPPGPAGVITWNGPDDPENPFNWPVAKKWRVTALACSMTFLSGLSGTALAPTAPLLTATFSLPPDDGAAIPPTYVPIFAWTLAAGLIPLALLPLMETRFGVRGPYVLCVLALALSMLPQALAPAGAFGLLVAARVVAGGAAGVLQNVTGGIVGDVWSGERARSAPVALYIWALVGGLVAGPVVGGATVWGADEGDGDGEVGRGGLGWRIICWWQLAIYAALVPVAFFALPETRGSVILERRRAGRPDHDGLRVEGEDGRGSPSASALLRDAVGRPLRMLTTEPLVACSTLWSAFCFGNALLFTQSIPRVYGELYGWESWRAGVVQAALLVGVTVGLVFGSPVQDAWFFRSAARTDDDDDDDAGEGKLKGLDVEKAMVGKEEQKRKRTRQDKLKRGRSNKQPATSQAAGAKEAGDAAEEGGVGEEEEEEEVDDEEDFVPEARLYLAIPASFVCLAGGLFVYAWTATRPAPPHWLAPTAGLGLVGAGIFTVVAAVSNYVEDAYARFAASALAAVALGENLTAACLPLAEPALYDALGLRWASCLLALVAVGLSFAPVLLVWKGRAVRERSPFIGEAGFK